MNKRRKFNNNDRSYWDWLPVDIKLTIYEYAVVKNVYVLIYGHKYRSQAETKEGIFFSKDKADDACNKLKAYVGTWNGWTLDQKTGWWWGDDLYIHIDCVELDLLNNKLFRLSNVCNY